MYPCELSKKGNNTSILIYCEGLEDSAFTKYLYILYHRKNSDPEIKIQGGRGGTADRIVQEAVGMYGEYTHKVVILDNDKGIKEINKARKIASENNIVLFENTPCFESTLLVILGEDNRKILTSTLKSKKLFEKKYFKGLNRTDPRDYKEIFPKSLINKRRNNIYILKKLYFLIRGDIDKAKSIEV